MKVLAVHRYYWPDSAPYASLLHSIVECWAAEGHEIDVISALPSYKKKSLNYSVGLNQKFEGVNIFRLNLKNESDGVFRRLFNAFYLVSNLFFRAVILKKYDVIMISTYPPVLGGFTAALASKISRARFIYHCMDLHPEIGALSGEFSNKYLFSLLMKIDAFSCSVANPVVVLSKDMAHSLDDRSPKNKNNIQIINNFSFCQKACESDVELNFDWPENGLVILFAGNVGRFQGLDALLGVMAELSNRSDIYLVIMGDGSEKTRLEKFVIESSANVRFIGHQSVNVAQRAMQLADIGFLSLLPDVYRYAYPSKTMNYLQQGLPILAYVEEESQLSQEISKYQAGFSVPNSDPNLLRETILCLANDRQKLKEMRKNARAFHELCFSPNTILPVWSGMIKK